MYSKCNTRSDKYIPLKRVQGNVQNQNEQRCLDSRGLSSCRMLILHPIITHQEPAIQATNQNE